MAGINIPDHVLGDLGDVAGCGMLNWLIMYSGVPLGDNPLSFFLGGSN